MFLFHVEHFLYQELLVILYPEGFITVETVSLVSVGFSLLDVVHTNFLQNMWSTSWHDGCLPTACFSHRILAVHVDYYQ